MSQKQTQKPKKQTEQNVEEQEHEEEVNETNTANVENNNQNDENNQNQTTKEKQKKEQQISEDQQKEIELRQAIAKAIAKKNYKESKELNEKLDAHIEQVYTKRLEEEANKLTEKTNAIIKEYRENVKTINNSNSFRSEPVRVSTDDAFETVKNQQMKQLTDLMLEKQLEIIKIKEQKTAEERQYEKTARNLANQKRYDEADVLQRRADTLHETNEKKNMLALNRSFDERTNKLLNQFRKELNIVKGKFDNQMEAVCNDTQEQILLEQKKLNIKIKEALKLGIRTANHQEEIDKDRNKKEKAITREKSLRTQRHLTNTVKKIVFEDKLANIIDLRK